MILKLVMCDFIEFASAKDLPKNFEPQAAEERTYQW